MNYPNLFFSSLVHEVEKRFGNPVRTKRLFNVTLKDLIRKRVLRLIASGYSTWGFAKEWDRLRMVDPTVHKDIEIALYSIGLTSDTIGQGEDEPTLCYFSEYPGCNSYMMKQACGIVDGILLTAHRTWVQKETEMRMRNILTPGSYDYGKTLTVNCKTCEFTYGEVA